MSKTDHDEHIERLQAENRALRTDLDTARHALALATDHVEMLAAVARRLETLDPILFADVARFRAILAGGAR